MLSREDMMRVLRETSSEEFLSGHILRCIPHVFGSNLAQHGAWIRELGRLIGVDADDLTIVGSGAVGISLNPHKNFKSFDRNSDIDVAVISERRFLEAWRYLRDNHRRRSQLAPDQKTRNSWEEHETRLVYSGTIATDRLLGVLPFGAEWLAATNHMAALEPTKGRDVKLRIYADRKAFTSYQTHSIKSAQESLSSCNVI